MKPLRRLFLFSVSLVLLLAINALPITQSNSTSATEAFNRFKKLAGKWQGRSTKGWQETVVFQRSQENQWSLKTRSTLIQTNA